MVVVLVVVDEEEKGEVEAVNTITGPRRVGPLNLKSLKALPSVWGGV